MRPGGPSGMRKVLGGFEDEVMGGYQVGALPGGSRRSATILYLTKNLELRTKMASLPRPLR
jgi:hypothetical protein